MKIIINGKEKSFKTPLNMQQLLEEEGYSEMTVAVARNGAFVPKGNYAELILESGDELEIVAPMQGG